MYYICYICKTSKTRERGSGRRSVTPLKSGVMIYRTRGYNLSFICQPMCVKAMCDMLTDLLTDLICKGSQWGTCLVSCDMACLQHFTVEIRGSGSTAWVLTSNRLTLVRYVKYEASYSLSACFQTAIYCALFAVIIKVYSSHNHRFGESGWWCWWSWWHVMEDMMILVFTSFVELRFLLLAISFTPEGGFWSSLSSLFILHAELSFFSAPVWESSPTSPVSSL